MPYVKRIVRAGNTVEIKKMYTGRIHTRGVHREKNKNKTSEAQHKVNERKAEERLRWKLNEYFRFGDYHVVLHYYDKPTNLDQAEEDKRKFIRLLRQAVKKTKKKWLFVACTEAKRSNPHHHLVIKKCDVDMLLPLWEQVVGVGNGNVSLKPLDRRQNHKKLAHYLIKETSETVRKYRELGKRYKRFTSAKGMVTPEPKYEVVNAASWTKEPRQRKGWSLWKDDDGSSVRTGIHDITGWPWQEYTEVWLGDGPPPGKQRLERITA